MFSHLPFDGVLLLLLLLTRSEEYIVEVGQNAYLPCFYTLDTPGNLVPVCWGKGACPVFECGDVVLRTDERDVSYRTSSRYWLNGDFHKGNVTLAIGNVTLEDSGIYCCRVQIPGIMNDKKFNLKLVIKPAKVTPAPTLPRDSTPAFPRMLTTEDHGPAETQTLEILHDKNLTQLSTLANELQDAGTTIRIGVYIGAGVSAGLALALIFGALIFKSSSLWPTSLPQGWQMQQQRGFAQKKIFIPLRRTYMKWRSPVSITAQSAACSNPHNLWVAALQCRRSNHFIFEFGIAFFKNYKLCQLTGFRGSVHCHGAEFSRFQKMTHMGIQL
ncbi:hepatitis A virus cellular receptor 2 isoform X1 [Callithrix jacchus]